MSDVNVQLLQVAATMVLAHAAGIRVFVTGGIGGVHRGYDISQVCTTVVTIC
jgi:pseudouridine-5'-phosphate glycosidase